MTSFIRQLNLSELLEKKSFFFFGPRSTGKSTLIRQQLGDRAKVIDLLDSRWYLRLSAYPGDLSAIIDESPRGDLVAIDEVQRIPMLLNEVHRLIEERKLRFLLTGSSARKLKRADVNLLAGRAWETHLYPLTCSEIPDFHLDRYLLHGGLPAVWQSDYPDEELNAYVSTYLKEEIQAEGLIRKLPPFSRFLRTIALSCGETINYSRIGADCQVSPSTVREYLQLLEDTLVGFTLEPWRGSKTRKAIESSRFYLFDPGVTHTLTGTMALDRNSNLYGRAFEQFIAMELRAYLTYRRRRSPLRFWRSTQGHEVDFIVGEHLAIEVKATRTVASRDLKGLKCLQGENHFKKFLLVSQDPIAMEKDGIRTLPWQQFLEELWQDRFEIP